MSKWIYQGKPLTEIPEGAYGFIYKITWGDKFYIGCKQFYSNRNVKISKKRANELYSGRGPKKKKELKIKESDWRTYTSSSWDAEFKESVENVNQEDFKWEILSIAYRSSELAYLEVKALICSDAILDENCINKWVSFKVRKNNI